MAVVKIKAARQRWHIHSQHYRREVARVRRMAKDCKDARVQQQLIGIARDYDRLAMWVRKLGL